MTTWNTKKVESTNLRLHGICMVGGPTQGHRRSRKEISCAPIDNDRHKISRTGNPALFAATQLVSHNYGEKAEGRKIETAWRETELHQTGSTLTPLDFKDFIPGADNPLSKASDGKAVGVEPGAMPR